MLQVMQRVEQHQYQSSRVTLYLNIPMLLYSSMHNHPEAKYKNGVAIIALIGTIVHRFEEKSGATDVPTTHELRKMAVVDGAYSNT
mmetsp:Transcript_1649/g.2452  ORF Transcript_1649/g.2452 Transcript_1649/m.2452 type:complete len:86 (-) Transcript_1649:52-309(-)